MGVLTKRTLEVKLDDHGYPGDVLVLWTSFPRRLMDGFWELVGDARIAGFLRESGILAGTSLQTEAGAPLPLEELPWDLYAVAVNSLISEVARISDAIRERIRTDEG